MIMISQQEPSLKQLFFLTIERSGICGGLKPRSFALTCSLDCLNKTVPHAHRNAFPGDGLGGKAPSFFCRKKNTRLDDGDVSH